MKFVVKCDIMIIYYTCSKQDDINEVMLFEALIISDVLFIIGLKEIKRLHPVFIFQVYIIIKNG